MSLDRFSPRDFLRGRRPETFSDSVVEEESALTESIFEYHLDSLTSRGQETDFERFARALIQREVCPNLLPQTGPTGGGDSKVDSETYPIAEALELTWYIGVASKAASERWAFAFSAKEDWPAKVKSDIAKIASTGRGYTKAFFITNQFVPDKKRAKTEDDLRAAHALDVRIFDRSWIVKRVFEGEHQQLAARELDISVPHLGRKRPGPLDVQRLQDLEVVEERIKSAAESNIIGLVFVDDCIEAASLARSLERPRNEIDGRLARAKEAAAKHGNIHQQFECRYEQAWTDYWWYEDFEAFASAYEAAHDLGIESEHFHDIALLVNLWIILQTLVRTGGLSGEEVEFDERTKSLAEVLDGFASHSDRPSAALHARTLRLQMTFLLQPEEIDNVIQEYMAIVEQAEGLIGFPLKTFARLLTELGDFIGDRPAYAKLFETLVRVMGKRDGEVSAARLLSKRGEQELDADRPYKAISLLGSSLTRLYKEEATGLLIQTLYLSSVAYERVGLLWAARGAAITAASLLIGPARTPGDLTPMTAALCNRLKWLELQLGRLPHVLVWHETEAATIGALDAAGYSVARLTETHPDFDAILGILLLRTEPWELKNLARLPDVLTELHLDMSSVALRFALGHEDDLPEELFPRGDEGISHEFARMWRNQPAAASLPDGPALYEQTTVELCSKVLGCKVLVVAENITPCIELAESIMAALESFLSTGMGERIIAYQPVLRLRIRGADFVEPPFQYELHDEDGEPRITIRCARFDPHNMSREDQQALREAMFHLLIEIVARIYLIDKPEQVLERLMGEDRAQDRALAFTGSFVTLANAIGENPKTSISDWYDTAHRTYDLRRSERWDAEEQGEGPVEGDVKRHALSSEDPPAELSLATAKHTEVDTVSVIRHSLWDKAGWLGILYVTTEGNVAPPVLALLFSSAEPAQAIFRHWRKEFGEHDANDRLRISVVRGVSKTNPSEYRVSIGSNPETAVPPGSRGFVLMQSRVHTMTPDSDENLSRFLQAYAERGAYILAHAVAGDGSKTPAPVFADCVSKTVLSVRQAWEIGPNDVDGCAVRPEDDPIIPGHAVDPPVVKLLEKLRLATDSGG